MIESKDHIEPELLSAYLDNEVSAAEHTVVAAHLPHCADCQRELAALRHVRTMMGELPLEPLPRTFYVTQQMVAPEPTTPSFWDRLRAVLGGKAIGGAVAATAALLFLIFVVPQINLGSGSDDATSQADMSESADVVEMVVVTPESGEAEIAMSESNDEEAAYDAADIAESEKLDTLPDDDDTRDSGAEESMQTDNDAAMAADAASTASSATDAGNAPTNVTPLRSESQVQSPPSESSDFPLFPIAAVVALVLFALIWYYSRRKVA